MDFNSVSLWTGRKSSCFTLVLYSSAQHGVSNMVGVQ